MADSRIDIRFVVHAEELKRGMKSIADDFKSATDNINKSSVALTAKDVSENNKRVASYTSASQAMADAARRRGELESVYNKKSTKELVALTVAETKAKRDAVDAIRLVEDKGIRADIQAKKQASEQRLAILRKELASRPDVQRKGAGVEAGILGTGRNLISQSGIPVGNMLSVAGGIGAATVAFKKLYEVGLENAKIQDNLRAGFQATGKSGYELAASVTAASRSAQTLGDKYLIDNNVIEQLTGTYLKFGGTSDNIAKKQELIIGLSERTGMSFDDAARALAKSTDPDIALELKRQGIVMGDAATEGERLNIVAKAVEGNLKGLADKANSEAGKVEKFKLGMDNLMDSLGEFAFNFGAPVVDVLNDITGALNKLFTTVEERSGSAARALVTAQMTVDEARAAGRKAALEAGDDAKLYEERFAGELENKKLEVAISASDKKVQELSKNTALSLKKQGKKTAEEVIAVMKSQNYFIDANVIKGVNEAFAKAKDKPKPTGTKSSTENPQKKLYDEQKKEWDALLRFQQDLEDIYREQEIQSEEEANLHKLEIEQAFIVKKLKLAEKANNIQDITELTRLQTLVNMRIDILRNAINEVDTLIPPDIQNGIIPVGLTNEDGETDFSGIKTPDESKAKLVETPDYVKDLANNAKSAFESLLFDPLDAMISKTTNGVDKFFMNITSQLLKLASSKLLEGIFGGLLAILNPASGLGFLGGFLKVFGIKFADGGIVPGVDTGKDTVPAVLRPGEFVLTRNAARAIGYDNLDGINSLARNPSLGLSGGLPHGGQDKQSIKIGGIIRRGDRPIGKRQDETDLGTDGSLRIGSLANAINRSNYNANFAVNNNGQLISEIRALRQVVAQQQTIVMDMYGVHLGTLRSRNANNIGVIA